MNIFLRPGEWLCDRLHSSRKDDRSAIALHINLVLWAVVACLLVWIVCALADISPLSVLAEDGKAGETQLSSPLPAGSLQARGGSPGQ